MTDAADQLRDFMRRQKPPTQERVASLLGVKQVYISEWLNRRKRPGLQYAPAIERRTGIKAESWLKVKLNRRPASKAKRAA